MLMSKEHLIADPKERREVAQEKEVAVLDWLRDEIYSTTAVLAEKLFISGNRSATLSTLYRLEKRGFLVRDEIRFMGRRTATLWGITAAGVLEGVPPGDIATMNLRHHTPGRVSPLTIEHSLDVQRVRIQLEDDEDWSDWVPGRLLPGQNQRKGHPDRWPVYPDATAIWPLNGKKYRMAVEVERTRKTPQRYVQVIRGHLSSIEAGRYAGVIYFCPTESQAVSLGALFRRLIADNEIVTWWEDEEVQSTERAVSKFVFKSIEGFKRS